MQYRFSSMFYLRSSDDEMFLDRWQNILLIYNTKEKIKIKICSYYAKQNYTKIRQ